MLSYDNVFAINIPPDELIAIHMGEYRSFGYSD